MPFDLQPTLIGQWVRLDPLRPEDHAALYQATSDPLIWAQHPEPDRCKPEVFRGYLEGAVASGGAFTVRNAASGAIIGCTRYLDYRPCESQIEIGYTFLVRSHWGGVYNGEMKRLMLRHAFQFVERVIFVVGPENFRSQRAVEKIGGVRAGIGFNTAGHPRVIFEVTAGRYARQDFT